jgi:uncharacterized delta-60 repeat protein
MSPRISGTKSVMKRPSQRKRLPFQKLATIAALLLVVLFAAGQVRAQSPLDGFDPGANDLVRVMVVQANGKILIGGDFTTLAPNGGATVTRNHIARLNPDGTLDTAFNPNANNLVLSIEVQPDGKILAGGIFTSIGGQTRNRIARLDANTGQADSFDPNANNTVNAIAVQADGKILVGGDFNGQQGQMTIGGQTRNFMARLDPATGLADSFDPGVAGSVEALRVQADGKILVAGGFGSIGGQTRHNLARLDPGTGLADSFDPNANSYVLGIAVQADGKILAGGQFTSIGGQTRHNIARLDATTGLADSFDPDATGADSAVFAVEVQPDGKILACGSFTSIGGQARNYIARLDATTGLADSLNPNANGVVFSIAVQADGKILVGGGFNGANSLGGQTRNHIARLERDGRLDQTVELNPIGVTATAMQPDGKVLIGGSFTNILGVPRNNIARLNTDRTLDTAFDPNVGSTTFVEIKALAVQADGKILVGGNFTSIGGQTRTRMARLDPITGQADSFDPNADNRVLSIAMQGDGKILVSGTFTNIGGQPRNGIARLDPTTGLADSFNPNANSEVGTMAVQTDGKIVVGGAFTSIGGQPRIRLARLDPVTGLADSFNPDPGGSVFAVLIQPDGKILAGGSIMKRYRPDGTRDTVFNTGFNGGATPIFTLGLQADGKILVGGIFTFTQIGGQQRNFFARLDAVTGLADSFQPGNVDAHSIVLQPDGKILVGAARLTNDTAAGQNLSVTRSAVTWTLTGSSPQVSRVIFEYSPDNVNYTVLGNGTFAGNSWTLTGLNLPIEQNFYVRARGFYRGGIQDGSESIMESVRNAFILQPSTLANISTRLRVQTGDNAMIGGFIITGTERKTVIVRGIGPSLPIPGALADPVIEVHGSAGQLLATNDNWNDSLTRQQIIDSGLAPANDLESALWGVIDPGAYTVVVRGNNNGTGIGLFEVYDLDPSANSKLANVSTRGFVETGNNVMIGGAILRGTASARVLLRAIGPSLTNFGVNNALSDPTLELHDGNGALIVANDNWRTDQEAQIIATGLPPSNNQESAIVRDLFPGNYTAIVRGANNATGVALIEAYELD